MHDSILLLPWMRLAMSIALELTLVFAVAGLAARCLRPATQQRTVWRLGFLVSAGLVLAELLGWGHAAVQSVRPVPAVPAVERAATFSVTVSPGPVMTPDMATTPAVAIAPASSGATASWPDWWPLLLPLTGLLWLLLRRLLALMSFARFGRGRLLESGGLEARAQDLARRLGMRRRIRIKVLPRLSSPIAFGVIHPVIGVPADFATSHTDGQQDAMLAHELAHVAAFDAVWIFAADLVTALVWWHPLAWWARRQLRGASESAADEASLLVEDGPAALAECLVTLGARLTRPPSLGGLGMAEARFRSGLGRRVERLLALRGEAGRPQLGLSAWVVRTMGCFALVSFALAAAAWLLPRAAHAETLGEAFQRSPLGLATTALLTADENDASKLLLQGMRHFDAGRTNEAETKWRAALELDPGNTFARDYLRQMGRTNLARPKPASHPETPAAVNPALRTNSIRMSKAQERLFQKLDSIVLGEVMFDNVPLKEVIRTISQESRTRDPNGTGIHIALAPVTRDGHYTPVPLADPVTGLPVAGQPDARADIGSTVIRLDPPARGFTLHQMLDVLVKVADRRLHYSVEDWGVLFSDGPSRPGLHTRWFRIDPSLVADNFNSGSRPSYPAAKPDAGAGGPSDEALRGLPTTPAPDPSVARVTVTPDRLASNILSYFRRAGVDLQPPNSITFNDRLGLLMVRSTLDDLDLVEQAVQALNASPPQVNLEVKFCELPDDQQATLGLDFFLGRTKTNLSTAKPLPSDGTPEAVRTGLRSAPTNGLMAGVTGILTPEQYRVVLRALEERKGVDIMSLPSVLTLSGRQAQLKTVEVRSVVTGLDLTLPPEPGKPVEYPPVTQQFECGPCVDLIPYVAADGLSIQLTAIPSIREFLGYDQEAPAGIWDYVDRPRANASPRSGGVPRIPQQPYPVPLFRLRQITARATVWDGQTLVLATSSSKITLPEGHPAQKLPREVFDRILATAAALQKQPRKLLLVFVTATIVDRAGNSVHTDEEVPGRTQSIPPQAPPAR